MKLCCLHSNADVEAEIAQLRAQLLHADQARELVQNQLAEEKEERERAQRKVGSSPVKQVTCDSQVTWLFLTHVRVRKLGSAILLL